MPIKTSKYIVIFYHSNLNDQEVWKITSIHYVHPILCTLHFRLDLWLGNSNKSMNGLSDARDDIDKVKTSLVLTISILYHAHYMLDWTIDVITQINSLNGLTHAKDDINKVISSCNSIRSSQRTIGAITLTISCL